MRRVPLPSGWKACAPLVVLGTLLLTAACSGPRLLARAAASLAPEVTYFFPTEERVVALTIDDGPDPDETPEILEVLDQYDAHATFFLIGSRIARNEALLDRIQARSHEVANHTFHDRASIRLSPLELAEELDATHELLQPYGDVRWFRPGSGLFDGEMVELARQRGYRVALGDVYPFDAQIHSSRLHAWYITRVVHPGSIIVLHDADGRGERTAETLRRVLPELREHGYEIVTLSERVSRSRARPTARR